LIKFYRLTCILLVVTLATIFIGCASTPPIRDDKGNTIINSIAIMDEVVLNGATQSLLIRGENRDNPLLLFLHGGPGNPASVFSHSYQREMEKYFTVVQWDQRGSGKSYGSIPAESMTKDQFLADTHALIVLLLKRYDKQKLYLIGHSWGSFLGITTAYKYPELIHAYVGTGQMVV